MEQTVADGQKVSKVILACSFLRLLIIFVIVVFPLTMMYSLFL